MYTCTTYMQKYLVIQIVVLLGILLVLVLLTALKISRSVNLYDNQHLYVQYHQAISNLRSHSHCRITSETLFVCFKQKIRIRMSQMT